MWPCVDEHSPAKNTFNWNHWRLDATQLGMLSIAEWAATSGLGVISSWREACLTMQNLFLETGAFSIIYCKKSSKTWKIFLLCDKIQNVMVEQW